MLILTLFAFIMKLNVERNKNNKTQKNFSLQIKFLTPKVHLHQQSTTVGFSNTREIQQIKNKNLKENSRRRMNDNFRTTTKKRNKHTHCWRQFLYIYSFVSYTWSCCSPFSLSLQSLFLTCVGVYQFYYEPVCG